MKAEKKRLQISLIYPILAARISLPFTVVLELVIASKCDEGSKADPEWPVDLSGSINPDLLLSHAKVTNLCIYTYVHNHHILLKGLLG